MSDELSTAATAAAPVTPATPAATSSAPAWRAPVLQAVATVGLSLVLGAIAGVLWHAWWTPATGLVWQHEWHKGLMWLHPTTMAQGWSENAHQDVFAATGTFVILTGAAGLITGLVSALWLARAELVTLASVVLGGVCGAAVTAWIGFAQSAADPNTLAARVPDRTRLPDNLHWAGPWLVLVFPAVALTVLVVVFLAFERRPSVPEELTAERSEPSPLR